LALPKLGTTWALNFVDQPLLLVIDPICGALFIGYIIVLILSNIFRQKEVTQETIYGAIVVYILFGLVWVYFYQFTEVLHPHSFSISTVPGDSQKSLYYYSFVTLTTLGYGDITPISGPARSLTTLEAIVGQMYIAVTIARLVGIHISQGLLKK
jgi:voltage-gated potassium channel